MCVFAARTHARTLLLERIKIREIVLLDRPDRYDANCQELDCRRCMEISERLVGRAAAGGCVRRRRRRLRGRGVGAGSGRVGGGLHGPALHDVGARRVDDRRERRHRDGGQEEHDQEHAGAGHYCDAASYLPWLLLACLLLLCVAIAMMVRGGVRMLIYETVWLFLG